MWTAPVFKSSQFPTCRRFIYQTHIYILTDKNAGLINQAPTNKSNCLAKKSVDLINQAPTNKSNSLAKKKCRFDKSSPYR